jgi:hypothetical protein
MTATAKVVNASHLIVLGGGGKVTLTGAGKTPDPLHEHLRQAAAVWTASHCNDQERPDLVVQNITFEDGNSTVSQSQGSYGGGGGGAVFDLGGQLMVVNSRFVDKAGTARRREKRRGAFLNAQSPSSRRRRATYSSSSSRMASSIGGCS